MWGCMKTQLFKRKRHGNVGIQKKASFFFKRKDNRYAGIQKKPSSLNVRDTEM